MFTKSINLVLLILLLTPACSFAQSDSNLVHKNNKESTLKYDVLYSSVIVFVFLTVFFYIDDRRNKRRNNDAAAAAAAAAATEGLNQSAAALQLLPVLVYSDFQKMNHAGTEKKECAICLTKFRGKDKLTLLPCKHVYHPHCIGTWFISKITCPLCRSDLKSAVVANMM
ncbi:hypothetical protein MKX03_020040 [Papaver bracteatum]|nr:hypothetical protein MKX03_020040 [Papaver bracteatum]